MRKTPTIRDVARVAGVSIATVSRVINGTGPVAADRAEAVRAAMAEIGFRPNAIGRQLKTSSSRTIGILVPSLFNPVFADSVQGCQEAAGAAGYATLLAATDYDPGRERSAVEALLANRVEGLVLTVADAAENETLDMLDAEGVPYVLVYNQPDEGGRPAVTVDNRRAMADLVRYLIGLGHQRFAMIAGSFTASDRSRLRFEGFADALSEAGLPPGLLLEVRFDDTEMAPLLAGLFSGRPAPTALVCTTDLLALAAIRSCRALGLAVPRDLTVTGFDGIALSALTSPSLTSLVQPSHAMGQQAVGHLLGRLGTGATPRQVILPHQIRPGESAAKPSPRLADVIPLRPTAPIAIEGETS